MPASMRCHGTRKYNLRKKLRRYGDDGCCRKAKDNVHPKAIRFNDWILMREWFPLCAGAGARLHTIWSRMGGR